MYKSKSVLALSFISLFLIFSASFGATTPAGIVVLQTDFGLKDGAVNAIKGVIYNVDRSLIISDITHEIPAYNIWEASYWLYQVAPYWPKGTVFVSVVDPGVGTPRRSIVAETTNGYYFVTPDNGTLTAIANNFNIQTVREIDENKNRLPGSYNSHTFHGRDVYGYTAARLAAGKITYAEVGPIYKGAIVKLETPKAYVKANKLHGEIIVLDPEYGNLWTNIDSDTVQKFGIEKNNFYKIKIYHDNKKVYEHNIPFKKTFGEVATGASLLYINSLMNLAVGINQDNFSKHYHVNSGPGWQIEVEKIKK